MPLYVTVSRGPRADRVTPVLASSDPRVVNAALEAIRRLGEPGEGDEGDEGDEAPSGTEWRLVERRVEATDEDDR